VKYLIVGNPLIANLSDSLEFSVASTLASLTGESESFFAAFAHSGASCLQ
jgi:hypothetical protein